MDDWVPIEKDEAHVSRERVKARVLRASAWWQAELAKGSCHYCGQAFASKDLTMDHIIPVSRGGRSIKSNVVPCCTACNKNKRSMTPAERILRELEESGDFAGLEFGA